MGGCALLQERSMRTKLVIELQYLGTHFIGWQSQPGESRPSVYDAVAKALNAIIDRAGGPVAAGRTDKGVHAGQQIVTVTIRREKPVSTTIEERSKELAVLRDALNVHLPPDVRAVHVHDALPSANAICGTNGKTYSYFLLEACPDGRSEWSPYCWALDSRLDVDAMERAALTFVGDHDFQAFTSIQGASHDTKRHVSSVRVRRISHHQFPLLGCYTSQADCLPRGRECCLECATNQLSQHIASCLAPEHTELVVPSDSCLEPRSSLMPSTPHHSTHRMALIQMTFCGTGFLKHQVRRMVGLLVRIGQRLEGEDVVQLALEHGREFDKRRASEAPATGLWLDAVDFSNLCGSGLASSARCARNTST